MKNIITILITIVLIFTITACSRDEAAPTNLKENNHEASKWISQDISAEKNNKEFKTVDTLHKEREAIQQETLEGEIEDSQTDEEQKVEDIEETITIESVSGTFYVNREIVNVRDGNGTDYNVVGNLKLNNEVEVKGKTDNGWYLFSYNGNDRFISGTLLSNKKIEPIASAEEGSTSTSESNYSNDSDSTSNSSETQNIEPTNPLIANMNVAKTTDQIVTVVSTGGGNAEIKYWKKSGDTWKLEMSTPGFVGARGVSDNKVEGDQKTPTGVYGMPFAFGLNNPNTKMNFRNITPNSYWISNSEDPEYNTWQERESSNSADEHLIKYTISYKYAIAIDYNMNNPIPGKGSAIFLHVSNGSPTLGCVSVPESKMHYFMQELDSNAKIVITSSESNLVNY